MLRKKTETEKTPLMFNRNSNAMVCDDNQTLPYNVQPVKTYCSWFSWLSALCCLCPPFALANYPGENITALFSNTLSQLKIDLLSTEKNESELKKLGFDQNKYNDAITKSSLPESTPFEITYAGHASLVIKLGTKHLLLDPTCGAASDYKRKIPEYYTDEVISNILNNNLLAVLVSHNHADHNNLLELEKVKNKQPHIITGEYSTWATELGYKNVHTLGWGKKKILQIDDNIKVAITGIPAEHASARKGYGCGGCIPTGILNRELWLGFFLEIEFVENAESKKCNIYVTGDTGEGNYFQDDKGNAVTLQQYVVALAKQIGGLDLMFAQVGPHEPFGNHGESPLHMGPSELINFSVGIISALQNSGNKAPAIIPVHHSVFAYEKPRGFFLLQFLQKAYQDLVLKNHVIPLAIGGSINLANLPDQAEQASSLESVVAGMYSQHSVFKNDDIQKFFGLASRSDIALPTTESESASFNVENSNYIHFTLRT